MRKKSFRMNGIALLVFAMPSLFASCSNEELVNTDNQTGLQTLRLTLNPRTRAAVYTDPGTTAENTMNRATIGIFNSDGSKVKSIQEVTSFTGTGHNEAGITTNQLAVGDQVLVAVNAKSGTFAGVQTASAFEGKTLSIDDALAGSVSTATTVANTNLPMFGIGTIAAVNGSSTNFTAAVDAYHMVAKVTLNSLNVNFDVNGAYNNATFTPTEVFMSNVPDILDFYPAKEINTYTFASNPTLYNGMTGDTKLKAYLGTTTTFGFTPKNATLKEISSGSNSSWGTTGTKILFLYTMPNNLSSTPTRLVIKGLFKADGTGDGTIVYYPVSINYNSSGSSVPDGGSTSRVVYPNKNYVIDVTIQGIGSDSPTTPIDPETVTTTITPQPFVNATQSNVFN